MAESYPVSQNHGSDSPSPCHVELVRSKCQVLLSLKRRGLNKGVDTRRWGSWGTLESVCDTECLNNSIHCYHLYIRRFYMKNHVFPDFKKPDAGYVSAWQVWWELKTSFPLRTGRSLLLPCQLPSPCVWPLNIMRAQPFSDLRAL